MAPCFSFQELAQAFKRLSFKTKFGEFKTAENPVLRIVGGVSVLASLLTHLGGWSAHDSSSTDGKFEPHAQPELVTRTTKPSLFHAHPSPRQILIFHPFILVRRTDLVAVSVSPEEVPPTESESRVIEKAKVVESYAEAEEVKKKTERGEDPDEAVAEVRGEQLGGKAPGDAATAEERVTVPPGEEAVASTGEQKKEKKKGWFGRW